jgi:hypothetical protein
MICLEWSHLAYTIETTCAIATAYAKVAPVRVEILIDDKLDLPDDSSASDIARDILK